MRFKSAYEPSEFEPEIYAAWENSGVFGKASDSFSRYSIVMPPPNANGNLHIGHGLTVAIEDSLTRYYRLRGNATWYVPGADHAGFETWVVYERELEKQGKTRFQYSRDELYARVWDFVQEQRGNMELQVRSLGASCAWDDLTFTLDENVVRRVYATFEKMWNDGMVYRGEKLVNYCPKHQTAFADIEVAHQDEKGKLWEIAYTISELMNDSSDHSLAEARSSASVVTEAPAAIPRPVACGPSAKEGLQESLREIIVSTTRPETLFGDTAVAVNPNDERYASLIGKTVRLPLTDREIPIVADEHADPEYGTGAVKITPAHDFDDFEVGLRHDLPRIQVITSDGKMQNCGPEYDGLTTAECRKKVLADLEAQGLLRGEKEITHAVAHCYKCDSVIEPMLKEQWFVNTEKLAAMAIERLEADEIKFYPENKKKVLINYLKGLKDWNISRQIPWGIAIPMFKRVDASNPSFAEARPSRPSLRGDGATSRRNSESSAKEDLQASTAETPEWIFDTRTHLTEIEYRGEKYVRDEDTFDTWFSSAHWPIVCTDWEEGVGSPFYPLNVMETGADILFAWVARMIMMGVYVTGKVPFREVYLHGLVLDAHGKKMSKSKGNVINPIELVSKYGSDAFRLGILRGRSAGMNQAFSENSVMAGRNLCNKLWNISRFIQSIVDESADESSNRSFSGRSGALAQVLGPSKEDSQDSSASYSNDNMGEDWICREIDGARKLLEKQMKDYRFSEAVETLYSLIWDKYADWFIESQKIYKNVPLLKKTLCDILVMLHPFAPFVTETIWQNLSWTEGMIVVEKWPPKLIYDPISAERFEKLMVIAKEIRGTLQAIPGGKKWPLLFGDDALVDDNSLLVQKLTGVTMVAPTDGQPRGIRLALENTELYLDVPSEVVAEYVSVLEERILSVGREVDALAARLQNPNYVDKAPAELVKETRDSLAEKQELIERLKKEREAI